MEIIIIMKNLPKPNLIQTWCCMPDTERSNSHVPQNIVEYVLVQRIGENVVGFIYSPSFRFLFFILSGYTAGGGFHNVPVHSPGIHDGRYWKESELQPQIVSAGVLFSGHKLCH